MAKRKGKEITAAKSRQQDHSGKITAAIERISDPKQTR
jgi:hypothetical protein